MTLAEVFVAIEALPFATAIREGAWLFPVIETIHVFALTLVVGSIGMLDLRLLGLRSTDRPVTEMAMELLPWTWVSFGIAAATGLLMFSSRAVSYAEDLPFRIKLVLLLLAGINMLIFHFTAYRSVQSWGDVTTPPPLARLAGGMSLLLWVGVVVAGRWIGFTIV